MVPRRCMAPTRWRVVGFAGCDAAPEPFELHDGHIGVGHSMDDRLAHAVEGNHVSKAFEVLRDSSFALQPGREARRRIRKFHDPVVGQHVEKGGSLRSKTISQCLSQHR